MRKCFGTWHHKVLKQLEQHQDQQKQLGGGGDAIQMHKPSPWAPMLF